MKEILDGSHEISKLITNANKPMIILGESFLKLNFSKYFFKKIKKFLIENNKINDEWNSLNIIFIGLM